MKKPLLITITVLLAVVFFSVNGYAKPERLTVKSYEEKIRTEKIKNAARKVDLSRIDDPDTRAVFKMVFEALGIKAGDMKGSI